jgi:hypothetical protein
MRKQALHNNGRVATMEMMTIIAIVIMITMMCGYDNDNGVQAM